MKALLRLFIPNMAAADDAAVVDFVPVRPKASDDPTQDPEAKRRLAVARAGVRYGKPWKCGPTDMAREVMDRLERDHYEVHPPRRQAVERVSANVRRIFK